MRKVLLCSPTAYYSSTDWTNNYRAAIMYMRAWLDSMGYTVDHVPLEDTSTALDSISAGDYEFAVIPHLRGSGWTTWTSGSGKPISRLVKGQTPIPTFVLGIDQNANAIVLANVGAGAWDASASARKTRWRGCDWYTTTASYTVTVQAHMAQYEVLQTAASNGQPTAWRYRGANSWVYVQGAQQYNGFGHGLHLLMADAIAAGHIQPPPKRHQIVIDIDDMPDGNLVGAARLADMERVYAAQQRMNMPCAWGVRPEDWVAGRIPSTVTAFIAARTADKGGLLYPVVHSGNWFWKDGTKSTKDTAFKADIATMDAAGIRTGWRSDRLDQWGYYYANNNAWDEQSFELGSPETAIWCDPATTTARVGYQWRVCRLDSLGGLNTEGYGPPRITTAGQRNVLRGIRLIGSHVSLSSAQVSMDYDDGSTGSSVAVNMWARLFAEAGIRRCATYIHGSNCYDGHSGGNAPGTRWLESLADLYRAGMSQVVEYVHGADLQSEDN